MFLCSESKEIDYCFKMADIHLTADGGYSSGELYNTVIESSTDWLMVHTVCSDKNYKKAGASGA